MADEKLRELQRKAAQGDREAEVKLARETLRAIDVLQLVGKLPPEAFLRAQADELTARLASEVAQHIEIDAADVAGEIDTYELAGEVVDQIDTYEIAERVAENIDASDVASNLDVEDVAQHIGVSDIAEYIDVSDVAGEIDLDALAAKVVERLEEAGLVVASEEE